MTIFDMLATPEKYIPQGLYCYHHEVCPFWDSKKGEYPDQEDGYCHFLAKSDWDINEESKDKTVIVTSQNKSEETTFSEIYGDEDIDVVSGKVIHFPLSLLWDQCKECDINMDDPDDIELTRTVLELNDGI